MVSKVTQTDDGWALLLSPDLLARLHIDADTPLEITTLGESMIVTPIVDGDRRAAFQSALAETNDKFADALRRLAQ